MRKLYLIGKKTNIVFSTYYIQMNCRTLNELSGALAAKGNTFQDNPISVKRFGDLIDLVQNGSITGKIDLYQDKHTY